jgi:hypothetical protein
LEPADVALGLGDAHACRVLVAQLGEGHLRLLQDERLLEDRVVLHALGLELPRLVRFPAFLPNLGEDVGGKEVLDHDDAVTLVRLDVRADVGVDCPSLRSRRSRAWQCRRQLVLVVVRSKLPILRL